MAAGGKSGGTDINRAVDRALAVLEHRVNLPGYLTNSSGVQLWVLTDSDSKPKGLEPLLQRMKALQARLWFQYHEIVLMNPKKLTSDAKKRHELINKAGFMVDYTANLKERIRIPQPWPGAQGKSVPLIGNYQVPCEAVAGEYEVQFEPPLVFDTCGERGERAPGKFTLTVRPVSLPAGNLSLSFPPAIDTASFGRPMRSIRVKGDWDKFPAGTSAEAEWSLDTRLSRLNRR